MNADVSGEKGWYRSFATVPARYTDVRTLPNHLRSSAFICGSNAFAAPDVRANRKD
jgi:hypothetical protein